MGIEKELIKVTKQKPIKKLEEVGVYRARLVRATSDLSDEVWDCVSKEAQMWVNEGIAAINEKREVPDFPDGSDDIITDEPVVNKSKKKAKKENKKSGAINYYYEILLTNTGISKDDAVVKLEEAGFNLAPTSVLRAYYNTKSLMKILTKLDMLK